MFGLIKRAREWVYAVRWVNSPVGKAVMSHCDEFFLNARNSQVKRKDLEINCWRKYLKYIHRQIHS